MKTLINAIGVLTPPCMKSHITYSFYIGENIKEIIINFQYYPLTLSDRSLSQSIIDDTLSGYGIHDKDEADWQKYLPLKNLLTLSIDDQLEFRGAAHKHENYQEVHISQASATQGFIKGAIIAGQWKLTISVHALLTEECTYKLEVKEVSLDE